jgi:hypothetical protein
VSGTGTEENPRPPAYSVRMLTSRPEHSVVSLQIIARNDKRRKERSMVLHLYSMPISEPDIARPPSVPI